MEWLVSQPRWLAALIIWGGGGLIGAAIIALAGKYIGYPWQRGLVLLLFGIIMGLLTGCKH